MSQDSAIGRPMMAIVAESPGGPKALRAVERPVPAPRPGEILIKIAAAGLNGADLLQRQGRYPMPPGANDILGLECSGTVVALGPGAAGFNIGDQVCALLIGGGYAEYVTVPAVQCLKLPHGVTLVEGGSLPEIANTVWTNVFEMGRLGPGESLLVHGGASGIGTMAIQLARALGSTVYATASSAEKCRVCEALGASRAINYKEEGFVDIVKRETGGAGVALRLGTRVELDFGVVQRKHLAITGSMLRPRPIAEKGRLVAAVGKAVWPLIERGQIKPVVDSIFPLAEAARAHERMESGAHIGKVLLTMG